MCKNEDKKKTLREFSRNVLDIFSFRYVTVDTHSVKFFMKKPRYESRGGYWIGECCGFFNNRKDLDLSEFMDQNGFHVLYSKCLLDMESS